ncbi:DNA-binding IclR family transcriptional regulator [Anoxybacillus calidus]|jgi:IclR family transcriptional regulator, KDG regulon repressor|uniref:DNA-binding IclR family transcriptional regulator n=1 Tax=[Anoxybacillus] calidus TaxID=575178 RepID=A0A7W0BUS4_9BACL|nr:IclR family transcriptional regulator [Anoxybacillus calidus]MBA2871133.1 DNA-binding IclR family transcriptional regulator [Anoxybacillus calidus]
MNKTVVKALELLQLFTTYEQLTLQEIVQLTKLPKTSVFRMVQSLMTTGFLKKEGEAYELGLSLLQFGCLVTERLDVRKVALPIMKQLREETNEAVNLVVKDGDEAIYVEKVETSEPVRVYTRVGRRAPLYAGACPRVLLTFMSIEEQKKYLDRVELIPITSKTIVNREELKNLINEAKKKGYTVSHSELADYSSAVAVPIFNHEGKVVAGLSVVGPENRFQSSYIEQLVPKLKHKAGQISKALGFIGGKDVEL